MQPPTTPEDSNPIDEDHRDELLYDALRDCVIESDDDPCFESIRAALAQEAKESVESFDQRYPRARNIFDEAMRERAGGASTFDPGELLVQLGARTGLRSSSAPTDDGIHHRSVFVSNDQLEPESLRADLYQLGARYQMAAHRNPDAPEIEERAWILEALSDPGFDQEKLAEFAKTCRTYLTGDKKGNRVREVERLASFIVEQRVPDFHGWAAVCIDYFRASCPTPRKKSKVPPVGEPWAERGAAIQAVGDAWKRDFYGGRSDDAVYTRTLLRELSYDPKDAFAHRRRRSSSD